MKIVLKNIGALKGEVEIAPGRLTVFCGGNNTGKTYAMYVLWALFERRVSHVLAFAEAIAEQLKLAGSVQIPLQDFCARHWTDLERGIATGLLNRLPSLFSAPPKHFTDAQILISLSLPDFLAFATKNPEFKRVVGVGPSSAMDVRLTKSDAGAVISLTVLDTGKLPHSAAVTDKLPNSLLAEIVSLLFIELILGTQVDGAFLLPAERCGLNLFYPDLDARNSAIMRGLKRDESASMDALRGLTVAQYAEPIAAYIQFLKDVPRFSGADGFHDQALALQDDIAQVDYRVGTDGMVTAKPKGSDAELSIHLTSSSVKSFYGLWAWLEKRAMPGDCLMIDEPELNLHPDNQCLVARLLVRLVKRGIRVVISTHSDYIVRELNNMIMLATKFPERIEMERRFVYDKSGAERLPAGDVAAYQFTSEGAGCCDISPEFGIEVASMDSAINRLNESNSAIYFALGDVLRPLIVADQVNLEGN